MDMSTRPTALTKEVYKTGKDCTNSMMLRRPPRSSTTFPAMAPDSHKLHSTGTARRVRATQCEPSLRTPPATGKQSAFTVHLCLPGTTWALYVCSSSKTIFNQHFPQPRKYPSSTTQLNYASANSSAHTHGHGQSLMLFTLNTD